MRVWINGKLSAFQAEDMGSIPITRSPAFRALRFGKPLVVSKAT